MPAWRKRRRKGEFSQSPSGDDNRARGPATLTTVSVQSDVSLGRAISCSRCSARVGDSHRKNPATPRVTARKMSELSINMRVLLVPDLDDSSHDDHANQHQGEHVLDDRDTDRVFP